MSNCKKFLDAWRAYEQACREQEGRDPRDLEESMPEAKAARMRLCRQFRNYLSHNPDPGFLEPTDRMLEFVRAEAEAMAMRGDVVKKHAKRPDKWLVDGRDKAHEALARVLPLGRELIVGWCGDDWCVWTIYDVMSAVLSMPRTMRLEAVRHKKTVPLFVPPTAPMEGLDVSRPVVCTSDGTAGGKLIGLVM